MKITESTMTDMNAIVAEYVRLRDKKAELNKSHKETIEKIDRVLEKFESYILQQLNAMGGDSVKTQSGTAYKTERRSARVKDWPAFIEFVKTHNLWEMLTRNCSKDAVLNYAEQNESLPPGIDLYREVVVNVRRS